MDQFLQNLDILRNICAEYILFDRQSALSMALTCRAFLELGLDQLWNKIEGFTPIMSCLPAELFAIRTVEGSRELVLLRPLVHDDLRRYETLYAHRIRTFRLSGGASEVSPGASVLHAIQLATNNRPGVLSPLIKKLDWHLPGSNNFHETYPFISLFLGRHLISLDVIVDPDVPLHITAIQSSLGCLRVLKRLNISELSNFNIGYHTLSIGRYLSSNSWDNLETFETSCMVSVPDIRKLSTLPGLLSLRIQPSMEPSTPFPLLGNNMQNHGGLIVDPGFPSLQTLMISHMTGLTNVIGLIQHLPSTLQRIDLLFINDSPSQEQCSLLFTTIQAFSNLQDLTIDANSGLSEEPLDLNTISSSVDLSTLSQLKELKTLNLQMSPPIILTPKDTTHFSFSKLTSLAVGGNEWLSGTMKQIPQIDHSHLLVIVCGCPSLLHLKLEWDASRLMGVKSYSLVAGAPFPLKHLNTGFSPIHSPSQVIAFLKAYFPSLTFVHSNYFEDEDCMYQKRWRVVHDAFDVHMF